MSLARCAGTALLFACVLAYSQEHKSPPVHFSFDRESFYADGRESEKSVLQTETQINCTRQGRSCIAATAEYYAGHPHVSVEYFQTLKWDADGIIATSQAVCMQRTMIVSFSNQSISISGTLKSLPKETTDACKAVGANEPYTDEFILKNSSKWNKAPYGQSNDK